MTDSTSRRWCQLHVWTVLTFVFCAVAAGEANVFGIPAWDEIPENVFDAWYQAAATDEEVFAFGWPVRFVYRGMRTTGDDRLWSQSLIHPGKTIYLRTWALVLDLVLVPCFVFGATAWIETLCRRNATGAKFGIGSMIAITGFIGSLLAIQIPREFAQTFDFVLWRFAELVRVATIAAFWFMVVDLLGRMFRSKERST